MLNVSHSGARSYHFRDVKKKLLPAGGGSGGRGGGALGRLARGAVGAAAFLPRATLSPAAVPAAPSRGRPPAPPPRRRRPLSLAHPPTPGPPPPRTCPAQPPRAALAPEKFLIFEKFRIFAPSIYNVMSTQKIDPKGVKKWIAIIIAVLSAIAGALGESATGITANFLGWL